jgi:hypothetical protein
MDQLDELTLELSESVLLDVSPDEAPLVEAMGPELLAAADAGQGDDGSLGLGVEVTVLAVVAVAVAKAVVEVVRDILVDQTSSWLTKRLEERRRKKQGAAAPPPAALLSPDAAARVRTVALERAVTLGLDQPKAALLAESIAGALGLPPAGGAPAPA